MVRAGLATPGAMTAHLPPLPVPCELALAAWNRAAPDFRLPDLLLALALDEVDDWDLMVMRLDAIRSAINESTRSAHGK